MFCHISSHTVHPFKNNQMTWLSKQTMLKSRQSLKEQFCQGHTVSDEILKLIYFKFKTDLVLVKRGFFVHPMRLFCYNW